MYIRIEQCCAIVPIIAEPNLIVTLDFFLAGLLTIVLVSLVWLFAFSSWKERRNFWNPLNIFFLILGISVSGQPTKLSERFVYGCILVVSLFYSSNVFALLTSFHVETGSVKPFSSYEELNSSGLIPIVHPNMFNITFAHEEPVLQRLVTFNFTS